MDRRRVVHWATAQDKAAWLAGAAIADAEQPAVRAFAAGFAPLAPADRARALHDWIRDRILYVEDPGDQEQFADSTIVLGRGFDDCDGKARLFVAAARAAGLEAHLRPVFYDPAGEDFGHVQAVVRYPGSERDPQADRHGFLVAEFIVPGAELGQGTEAWDGRGHFR